MKITEADTVTDVLCDVCRCTTRLDTGENQFGTLQASWGRGTVHDGDRYELHLCEDCFLKTVAYVKQERRIQNLLSDDVDLTEFDFGLVR